MASPEPDIASVERAARDLAGLTIKTPLLSSPLLDERLGARVLVKAEPLQRGGSFKFRGAYTKIFRLTPEARAKGVVAYSSGNHAQGVAAAAKIFGIPATIVMPADAPKVKIANTKAYGAQVVLFDRDKDDREAIGRKIQAELGCALVPPFDDPDIIAGQGTVGLEIAADCADRGIKPDAVLVPCGGGGLVAGASMALAARLPGVPVHSVEPAGFDDFARSLAAGKRLANAPGAKSYCDALLSPSTSDLTFAVARRHVQSGLAVTDAEVAEAIRVAFADLKLVVEPGGAVALAAILAGKIPVRGRTVIAVASGGSVDAALYADILAKAF
ncbi:MAG: threonine/serine dehydratase [Alphaproteobacteria bacterium]|nr:threonine/serine dehydratase [Alphaproteobacteria bacterium]